MTALVRLPDAASLEAVLAGLDPVSADADLIPALTRAFLEFDFRLARIDDDYCATSPCVFPTATPADCFARRIEPTAFEEREWTTPTP